MDAEDVVLDLFYGRWRSQTVHAAVELGIFESMRPLPARADDVARDLGLDPEMACRLMRALAAMRLLREGDDGSFALEPPGEYLRRDHPQSMRDAVLLREGAEHTAIWKHLPDIVRDGRGSGFSREFGMEAFEYATRVQSYGDAFNAGMSSQSNLQTAWALEAFEQVDMSSLRRLCDVGGGHGHLLSHLVHRYGHVSGTVFDRAGVADAAVSPWVGRLGVDDRCTFVAGDMFEEVPPADAYTLKLILHDWNDDDCVRILQTLRRCGSSGARVFIIEHVIPDTGGSDHAALFDMHMMCWGGGRERTDREYRHLLGASGWNHVATRFPRRGAMGLIEGASTT